MNLGPGTLYTAITRLMDENWIEPVEATRRQRPYRITPGGLEHLRAQLEKMRQLANLRTEEAENGMKIRDLLRRIYPSSWCNASSRSGARAFSVGARPVQGIL